MTTDARLRFLERRLTGIGASDAPIILGLGYISAAELWEQKTGRAKPQPESFEMKLGTMLEPVVSKLAEEKLAEIIGEPVRLSARNRFRRRAGAKWQFCHIDRSVGGIPVELKVPQWTAHEWGDEEEGEKGVALRYRPQVQHQIAVLDVPYAYVAALMPGRSSDPFRLYRVDRNDEQIAVLDEAEAEFWRRVQDDEPVEPDGSESGRSFLRRRFPTDDGTTLVATAEQRLIVEQLLDAVDARKAAEKREKDLKAKVAFWMKNARTMVGPGFEIAYPSYPKTKIEWETVAGVYRKLLDEVAALAPKMREALFVGSLPDLPSVAKLDGPDLDAIESLYTRVDNERRMTPTRKEGR